MDKFNGLGHFRNEIAIFADDPNLLFVNNLYIGQYSLWAVDKAV